MWKVFVVGRLCMEFWRFGFQNVDANMSETSSIHDIRLLRLLLLLLLQALRMASTK